jgi:5-methylcytosine-specific restriction endonuclease McrA
MDITSRTDAKKAGLTRYFTGKPCKHGHVAERYVANCLCVGCSPAIQKAWYDKRPKKEKKPSKNLWKDPEYKRAYFRQWRKDNLDQSSEIKRKWRSKNPGYGTQWSRDHPEVAHNYYQNNKAKVAVTTRIWRRKNRAKCQAYGLNYWARLKNAPGSFTEQDVEAILEQQQYRCAAPHCQTDILRSFHIDHILPLSRGGSNWPDNLQALCKSCNSQKKDKTMDEWLTHLQKIKKAA